MLRFLNFCILVFLFSLFVFISFARNPDLTRSKSGLRPGWTLVATTIGKLTSNPLSIAILAVCFVHAAFFVLAANTIIERWLHEGTVMVLPGIEVNA